MQTTVLQAIVAFIYGNRYYANIVNTRGTAKFEVASFIFNTREEAESHRQTLETTRSYQFVETISFRSRKIYGQPINK